MPGQRDHSRVGVTAMSLTHHPRTRRALPFFLMTLLGLAGCSGYQLRGKVVPGPESQILVVDKNDPRLQHDGIFGARVQVALDPNRLNRKELGQAVTDESGEFSIPVDEIGAGFLIYQVGVTVQIPGHLPALRDMALPGAGKRLLVTMSPGDDRLPARRKDFTHQTLELAEPYRDGR